MSQLTSACPTDMCGKRECKQPMNRTDCSSRCNPPHKSECRAANSSSPGTRQLFNDIFLQFEWVEKLS